ncbi:MAG TPA: hypothetical protein ENN46_03640 [Candidatus Woesearchaeota archaeon]|nr:hypothetical protein [Candidatus Woesearchaeota archaeon]
MDKFREKKFNVIIKGIKGADKREYITSFKKITLDSILSEYLKNPEFFISEFNSLVEKYIESKSRLDKRVAEAKSLGITDLEATKRAKEVAEAYREAMKCVEEMPIASLSPFYAQSFIHYLNSNGLRKTEYDLFEKLNEEIFRQSKLAFSFCINDISKAQEDSLEYLELNYAAETENY